MARKKSKMPGIGNSGSTPWYGIGVLVIIFLVIGSVGYMIYQTTIKGDEIPLNEIYERIDKGDYDEILVKDNEVVLVQDDQRNYAPTDPSGDYDFFSSLQAEGLELKSLDDIKFQPDLNISFSDIITVIFLAVGLGLVFMMVRGMQSSGGRLLDFSQSKAKLIFGKKTGVSFDDVAGIDEAKEELEEVVDFLKHPKKYLELGARIPRGVLLVGAPGTGKTLLAKAVAGEASVPFFHTSGSEFEEMLVGAGAARVRDLFKKAKKASPCIIFIDEIDAVAKKRGTVVHSGTGEQTLNQILVEMDGLEDRTNVIVLGATNRPDVLDPAVLRPGRFDRSVTVDMPDMKGRHAILDVHAENKKLGEDIDLERIAKKTIGYSGADLENLLNEAAIMAAKDGRKEMRQSDLLEAYLKVKLGRKKKGKISTDDELERIAYHEAGHAIVGHFVGDSTFVERVSIISRGGSGGVTVYTPKEETRLTKRSDLEARIASSVAGKLAEEIYLDEMTTGASSDIRSATDIARAMVKRYGMSKVAGFISYGDQQDSGYLGYQYDSGRDYSEETARMLDQEIKKLIDDAQEHATSVLKENEGLLKKLVDILLEHEEIDKVDFEKLMKGEEISLDGKEVSLDDTPEKSDKKDNKKGKDSK